MKKVLSMALSICLILSLTLGCFPVYGSAETSYSADVLEYVEANTEEQDVEFGAYWTPEGNSYSVDSGEVDEDGNPIMVVDEDAYAALLQKYLDAGLDFAVTGNEVYSPTHLDLTVRTAAKVGLDIWYNMCLSSGVPTGVATYSDMWYKYLVTAYLGLDYYEKAYNYVSMLDYIHYADYSALSSYVSQSAEDWAGLSTSEKVAACEGINETDRETIWNSLDEDAKLAVWNSLSSSESRAQFDIIWETYKDQINVNALAKLYICDEPGTLTSNASELYENFSQLEAKLDAYGITTPVGINFFPMTVMTGADGTPQYNFLNKYTNYLDAYLKTESTKIDVDWFMYDYYMSQGTAASLLIPPYILNQFYAMNYSQELDVPMYTFVNVVKQNGGALYNPTQNQLLEAVHLRLLLGNEAICYFLGWPAYNNSNGEWSDAMFNTDGSTTFTYTKVKNVNEKIDGMK